MKISKQIEQTDFRAEIYPMPRILSFDIQSRENCNLTVASLQWLEKHNLIEQYPDGSYMAKSSTMRSLRKNFYQINVFQVFDGIVRVVRTATVFCA